MSVVSLTLDEALELNTVSVFQYRLLLMTGFAFMADSLEINLLSFLSACAGAEWGLSNVQQATITAAVFAGIIIGSLYWGIMADRCGRKKTLLWSVAAILCGGFLSGAAPSYLWLLLFRSIAGLGLGGASVPVDILAEFLPSSHRGTFLVYIEMFWTFGAVFVAGLAWLTLSRFGWRFLAYVTAAPVAVTSILSLFYLPESPHWLLLKGRAEEAADVVRAAAQVNGVDIGEFELIPAGAGAISASSPDPGWNEEGRCKGSPSGAVVNTAAVDAEGAEEEEEEEAGDATHARYVDLLLDPSARRVMLPLAAVSFLYGVSYYATVLFVTRVYSNHDSLAAAAGGEGKGADGVEGQVCRFDYAPIFYNSVTEVLAVLLTSLLVDRWGRVPCQVSSYLVGGAAVLGMGLPGLSATALLLTSSIARMAAMCASTVTVVSTPELFSTRLRTVGHSSCHCISKIGSCLAPFLVVSDAPVVAVGTVISLLSVAAAGFAALLPESSGKQLGFGSLGSSDKCSGDDDCVEYCVDSDGHQLCPSGPLGPGQGEEGNEGGKGWTSWPPQKWLPQKWLPQQRVVGISSQGIVLNPMAVGGCTEDNVRGNGMAGNAGHHGNTVDGKQWDVGFTAVAADAPLPPNRNSSFGEHRLL